jgi:hypothetical protein
MKICKKDMSESRQIPHARVGWRERVRSGASWARTLGLGGFLIASVLVHASCRRTSDPGFDIVPVGSSAYLAPTARPDAGRVASDAGVRTSDGGSGAPPVIVCEPPPDDDFEPSDEIAECPATNERSWQLDPEATQRRRERADVCCYKRGVVILTPID